MRSNAVGDSAIARPIIGRLITARRQYAWMTSRNRPGLGPRPVFVDARTVDLLGARGGSRGSVLGEHGRGIRDGALGPRTCAHRGHADGQAGAAVGRIELPYSRIAVQISTEPVYAIDGTPRWELEPDVVVNPRGGADGNDPFIAAAIEELERGRPATR